MEVVFAGTASSPSQRMRRSRPRQGRVWPRNFLLGRGARAAHHLGQSRQVRQHDSWAELEAGNLKAGGRSEQGRGE